MSITTTNDHATDVAPAGARLVDVDPRTLVLEVNVRRDADLDADFLASIRDLGVLTPVLVQSREDGLHVRAGQRRTLAAVEVGRATIPAYVVDGDPDEARRIIEQMAENDHRRALGDPDRVEAFQQLALLGLTAEQIARRTATKKDRVAAALTVAGSQVAHAVTREHDLTLDQGAVIAEFEGDEKAVQELTDLAVKDPGRFVHRAQRMRDDRDYAAAVAALTADLTERGVRLVRAPGWEDKKTKALDSLAAAGDAEHAPLTADTHTTCPGHVVWIGRSGGTAVPVPGCEGWRKNGHADRNSYSTGSRSGPMTDEEKAERKALIANNKAWPSAETVRRGWLTTFAARKTAPKDAPAFIAAALARSTAPDDDALRLARTLLGLAERTSWSDPDPIAEAIGKASQARAQHLALVLILASIEQRTGIHTWRRPSPEARAYFTALSAWGYGLSDVEHLVLAEQPTPVAAPERTAPDDERDLTEHDEPDDAA